MRNTVVAIDIGTSKVRVIVAKRPEKEGDKPQVIGVGEEDSFGMRKGLVVDIEETANAINKAVESAERMAGVPVENAFVSISNGDITSQATKGAIAISRADGEVSPGDVNRAIEQAETISIPNNKEIIHVIPRKYALDNQDEIKDPIGMSGVRLEADCLIIEASSSHLKNIRKCLFQTGISENDLVLAPLAAEMAALSKRQKELGVALVTIGGGTTSVAVYDQGELLHVGVIPIGGANITYDIAIGLRTSVEVAEELKIKFGSCLPAEIGKKDQIDLSKFDKNEENIISRRHVAEIIEARLEEIFELVNKELKKVDRDGMLPAGAVLVGGSSKLIGSVDLAKEVLKLPTQNGFPKELGGIVDKIDEPGFITAAGLIFWGLENFEGKTKWPSWPISFPFPKNDVVGRIKKWITDEFLP